MKSFLNRTRVDPNKFQYKVSSNTFVDKFWSIDKERKIRKKSQSNKTPSNSAISFTNSTSNITNNSRDSSKNITTNRKSFVSEKIVIGAIKIGQAPVQTDRNVEMMNKKKKVRKKKKKKIKDKDNDDENNDDDSNIDIILPSINFEILYLWLIVAIIVLLLLIIIFYLREISVFLT
jgi:hypothetical protein